MMAIDSFLALENNSKSSNKEACSPYSHDSGVESTGANEQNAGSKSEDGTVDTAKV